MVDDHAETRAQQPLDEERFGPYEIEGEIARGGMGVVYRARHRQLGRAAALKLLHASRDASPRLLERFRREAKLAASLSHPAIVPIHDVGEVDGTPYIAMELVDGDPLSDLLEKGPLPLTDGLRLVARVARAIDHAHTRGVVHRDIKPANILVQRDGMPRVTDFGLAKSLEDLSGLTESGDTLGTPAFMAPEQVDGPADGIGPATDIHALGLVAYQVATGRLAFIGNNKANLFYKILNEMPQPPSRVDASIPVTLDAIVARALAKRPADRHPSAGVLADELEALADGRRPPAPPARATRGRLWPPIVGLAALIAVAVLLGGWLDRPPDDAGGSAEAPQRTPDVPVWAQLLASAHRSVESDQRELADKQLTRALELQPTSVEARRLRAENRIALGRWEDVDGDLTAVLAAQPNDHEMRVNRGVARLKAKRIADARDDFATARAQGAIGEDCLAGLGRCLVLLRDSTAALEVYRELVDRHPKHLDGLFQVGQLLHGKQRYAEAIRAYSRLLDLAPHSVQGLTRRGACHLELRKFAPALADFDRALERKPEDPELHQSRGTVLRLLGRFADADAALTRSLERRPDHARTLLTRSNVRKTLTRFTDAEADCVAGLRLDPRSVDFLYARARVRDAMGDPEGAVRYWKQVMALRSELKDRLSHQLTRAGRELRGGDGLPSPDRDWSAPFDGHSFRGWKAGPGWTLAEGAILGDASAGDTALVSEGLAPGDFHLRLEVGGLAEGKAELVLRVGAESGGVRLERALLSEVGRWYRLDVQVRGESMSIRLEGSLATKRYTVPAGPRELHLTLRKGGKCVLRAIQLQR